MSSSTRAVDPAGEPVSAHVQADVATLPVRNRMALMWAIMGVSICQFLDSSIGNVALPHMKTSLGASQDSISWVLTSFIMAGAIVTPITGWLSDRFGSRNLFLLATVLFLVSSALCGAATSLTMMVVFRVLQGAASALMGPLSQTLMFDINPPSKQASAIGLWGTVSMVAPISGPFLGGYITEYMNWRWVYYINLPIGLPALFCMWLWLPSRPIVARHLDKFGIATIALGLGALQLALDRGQQQGWLESWEIIIELAVAGACLWMFVIRSIQSDHPLFHPQLYKNVNFLAGIAFMTMLAIANISLSATLPTMYQTIYGYNVVTTGMLMAPRGFALTVSMMLTNYLVQKVDFRLLISTGFAILAFALWNISGWALEMEYQHIVYFGTIQGLGLGLIFTPISMVAFGSLDPSLRTDGSSLLGLFRNLGASFGITVIVTMLARLTEISHADLASHVTGSMLGGPVDLATLEGMGQDSSIAALSMADMEVNRQAMMIAYIDTYRSMAWVLMAFVPIPWLLPKADKPGYG